MSEALFQSQVIQVAATCGWDAHHIKAGKYGAIYKTDGLVGMPDLILIGRYGQGIIWAELKAENGRLSPAQKQRLAQLEANGQEVYVWFPKDLPKVLDRLKRRK